MNVAIRIVGMPNFVCLVICFVPARAAEIQYAPPVELCRLENRKINESSGVAASRLHPNRFWTHNDSGDKSRLFCFDREGKHLGTCRLKDASVYDWEDMCSFHLDGKAKLLVADTGDNATKRKACYLHILDEPENPKTDVKRFHTVRLRYETGAVDCEAIGVDVHSRTIILIQKKIGLTCQVFAAPLPDPDQSDVLAKQIATLRIPIVTSMDISADGNRAIVLTLGQAFEFTRKSGQSWQEAFRAVPRTVNMPPRRQGEAICYGNGRLDLYLTSERSPTPLFMVPVIDQQDTETSAPLNLDSKPAN